MEVISVRCQKCEQTYTLGRDAIVVTKLGMMSDFQGAIILGDGSSFVDNRDYPDGIYVLERSWSSLEASAKQDQDTEIRRILSLLSTGRPRWWRCEKCGDVQTYQRLAEKKLYQEEPSARVQQEPKLSAEAIARRKKELSAKPGFLMSADEKLEASILARTGTASDEEEAAKASTAALRDATASPRRKWWQFWR